jgi:hypothetical protein
MKTAFSHAIDHAQALYATKDGGGEERVYLLIAREFFAGLGLLDTMVIHDRFATFGDLKAIQNALLRYRDMLTDDRWELQARNLTALLHEIADVEVKAFAS